MRTRTYALEVKLVRITSETDHYGKRLARTKTERKELAERYHGSFSHGPKRIALAKYQEVMDFLDSLDPDTRKASRIIRTVTVRGKNG